MTRKLFTIFAIISACLCGNAGDTIPSGFKKPLTWRIGADITPGIIPGNNSFLRGNNPTGKDVRSSLSGGIKADFSFDRSTLQGALYKGLYQGIGVEVSSFFADNVLGTPVSVYVYQGAPIAKFNNNLSLLYEWEFGAAFGWKRYSEQSVDNHAPVSTFATAHMSVELKLQYRLSNRCDMTFGLEAIHFSNGNTHFPNAGLNRLAATIGVAYTINPAKESTPANTADLEKEADRGKWIYDITAFGAWRKRVVSVGEPADLYICPGKFGIAGIQFSPMRKLNRWVAVGPALDMQWDEGAGIAPYWFESTTNNEIKFRRPPFGKQLNIGLSAHAELTMPIFSLNAGLGYDFISPSGEKRFYQSLTLKTFITKEIYINTGYRLGNFKDPQNLMLGLGVRI